MSFKPPAPRPSPLSFLALPRAWKDAAFTWAGFLATFFGLAMLLIFLGQLAFQVADWFDYVPQLVAKENEATLQARQDLKKIEGIKAQTKQNIDEEYRQNLIKGDLGEPRKDYLEALENAKKGADEKQLLNIAKLQHEMTGTDDGKDGLYKTARRYQEALAAAPNEDVKEKLVALKALQDAYEGPGGVYETQLSNLDLTIAEKKAIADMPLRDTSSWGVFVHFLTSGPSNKPQDAGIYPALLGSVWIGLITILFAVPIGVGAALYLEEYKHAGWLGRLIQININNLAGVPSVVYGILGAFVFVAFSKFLDRLFPDAGIAARNTLGGGLTLGLLTLPVVIVSAQEAIRAVPGSIRHGAYALGATHWQVIWHNVLPMSLPGILTGSILSLSRAIGEAAPLVLFGALLFVNQEPSLFSRFTILPMQIFGWADRPPEIIDGESIDIWKYNAAMAIVVLMTALLAMNALAIFLRNRAQKRLRY